MRVIALSAAALLFFGVPALAADPIPPVTVEHQVNDTVVSPDGTSVQVVHAEFRANNDAGAMRLNQMQLSFDQAHQDLKINEAYTQKPDGTKIPIDMNAIFVRMPQDDDHSGEVTDHRIKVIVFPQVAAGDTVVYTATYTNTLPTFPGIYTSGMAFLPQAPFKDVRDSITAPKSMNLKVETHDLEFSTEDKGANIVYHWRYAAKPGAVLKKVAVSPIDQLPRYFVSNFKDYADLGRAFNALLQPKLVVTPKVKALADQLTAGERDRREQIRKIYEWVDSNIRYIALELGQSTMVPHDVDAILTYGYGDCKDHDLLLRALLKAKGITSQSVLLNSSNAYTLTQVPTFYQLDHVITYVPEFKLFMDSSALATPFGVLPYSEYGKPAVYVANDNSTFGSMPVLQPGVAVETTTSVMKLSASGELTGKTTISATGPSQVLLRYIGLAMQVVAPEKIAAEQLQARGYRGGTGTLYANPPFVRSPTYTINGEFTIPGWSEWLSGSKVSFMPIGLRILGVAGDGPMGTIAGLATNDLGPVPCFSVKQVEDNSLEIPAGTRFASMPVDTHITSENIDFTAHWSVSGNVMTVHREFRSTVKEAICSGPVRRQAAQALFQIATSYLGQIRIVPVTAGSAVVSENKVTKPMMGPNPFAAPDQKADESLVAVARAGDNNKATRMIAALAPAHGNSNHGAPNYEAHLAQGLNYLHNSQLDKAVSELSEAIRLNPEAGPEPYSARATAYTKLNKSKLALADLEIALKASPNDIKLRESHAALLVQIRAFDAAAADYNRIVQAKPNDATAVLARAEARYHADKYDEAAADYRRALKLGAVEADVHPGFCRALARTTEYAKAVDVCSASLARASDPGIQESRGVAYYRMGKYSEAMKDFQAVLKTDPASPRYLYERGITALKLGDAAGQKDVDDATKSVPNIVRKVPWGLVK